MFIAEHGGQRSQASMLTAGPSTTGRPSGCWRPCRPTSAVDTLAMKARVLTLEEVQVHAMLATVHDDAYSEYLDLKSMEEMRERVGRDARRDVT